MNPNYTSDSIYNPVVQKFRGWYNVQLQHSHILFVTPAQRHGIENQTIPIKRLQLYEDARAKHREPRIGKTGKSELIGVVVLNPNRLPDWAETAG